MLPWETEQSITAIQATKWKALTWSAIKKENALSSWSAIKVENGADPNQIAQVGGPKPSSAVLHEVL